MTSVVFDSDRLRFRPLEQTDEGFLRHICVDVDVMRYVGGCYDPATLTVETVATLCRRSMGGGIGVWVVSDRASGEPLGTAILLPLPVFDADTVWSDVVGDGVPAMDIEIGYMFRRTAWGRGIATEACTRLVRFAFEDTPLRHVVAVTDASNRSSQSVLMKSGLRWDGWRVAYRELLPAFRIERSQWLADRNTR